jgi:plastocyanin
MKTKILLIALLLQASFSGFSITHQISANSSQFSFSPSSITIDLGDEVNFVLASSHDALEVSQSTWLSNGTTSNGGFSVPFGGGLVTASQLPVGTHYYICTSHADSGMKGTITVVGTTGINETKLPVNISLAPNPARDYFSITLNDNALLNSEFVLYNLIGKQMLTGKLMAKTTNVNINSLSPGMYFVRLAGNRNSAHKLEVRK